MTSRRGARCLPARLPRDGHTDVMTTSCDATVCNASTRSTAAVSSCRISPASDLHTSGGRQATISGGGGASKDGTKSNLDPDNAKLLATQHPAVEVHQTIVWWRLIASDGLHFGQWRRRRILMRDLGVCAVHKLGGFISNSEVVTFLGPVLTCAPSR